MPASVRDRTRACGYACPRPRSRERHGPAAPRPPDFDRRVVPASGGPRVAHAHRRRARVRGSAAGVRATTSTTSAAGCTWSRATARSSPRRRLRPGGRCGSTTRASTSSTTSATPRCPAPGTRGAAVPARRRGSPPSSSTAPSRCGRAGSSRASSDGRFALIFKTHHSLVDGVSGVDLATVLFDLEREPPAAERRPGAVAAAARALRRRAGRRRRPRHGHHDRRAGRAGARRRHPARHARSSCCATPPRASARSSGRGSTRPPRRRSTSRSGRTGATPSCASSWPSTRRSRTRSAGPSTTSC